MKIVILYKKNSEHTRVAEDYSRDLANSVQNVDVELIDVDSQSGTDMATLYDILDYPAILVIREDGQLQQMWQGSMLPLMDEVKSNLR